MAIETFPHPSDPGFTPDFETADGIKYHYNGFGWEMECSGGSGGPQMVYYGADLPTGDIPTGSLFTHEDTLKQFVLQDDGTWVETDGCHGGGSGGSGEQMVYYGQQPPDDAVTGSFFTQEDTLKVYVLQDDGTWVETTSCSGDGSSGGCNFTDLECESIRAIISPYVTFDRYFHFVAYESSLGIFVNAVRFEWSSNESDGFYDGPYEWEIDLTGDDSWKDVSALTADEITKSGWQQQDLTQSIRINFANPPGDGTYAANTDYPCLRVRCTASNYNSQGLEAKKTTPPLYVFVDAPQNQAPANETPAPKPSWCTT